MFFLWAWIPKPRTRRKKNSQDRAGGWKIKNALRWMCSNKLGQFASFNTSQRLYFVGKTNDGSSTFDLRRSTRYRNATIEIYSCDRFINHVPVFIEPFDSGPNIIPDELLCTKRGFNNYLSNSYLLKLWLFIK